VPSGTSAVDVYLDACCFIYLLEGVPEWRSVVDARLRVLLAMPNVGLMTSRLALLECRAKPIRDGNLALLAQFDALFSAHRMTLLEVAPRVIERATDLRARYNFKTPDALHAATALEASVSLFLTGDAGFRRCTELPVEVLTPASPPP